MVCPACYVHLQRQRDGQHQPAGDAKRRKSAEGRCTHPAFNSLPEFNDGGAEPDVPVDTTISTATDCLQVIPDEPIGDGSQSRDRLETEGFLHQVVQNSRLVATANPHEYARAQSFARLAKSLLNSEAVLLASAFTHMCDILKKLNIAQDQNVS